MLNKVIIMGRITHDLELKQTPSGLSVLSFTVAVERNFKGQNGERQTDFISCVAWAKTAEHICRYFSKGRMIAIEGNLRTRTYEDKNGTRHYVTEVFVDSVSFTGERSDSPQGSNNSGYGTYQDGYSNNQQAYNNQPTAYPQQGYVQDPDVLSDGGVPF